MDKYESWMSAALDVAREALDSGDVPVGAIVVDPDGNIVGTGCNRREEDGDPTAHAEIVAIREAADVEGTWRLDEHHLQHSSA